MYTLYIARATHFYPQQLCNTYIHVHVTCNIHGVSKKTWHYIFNDNFNKNCPIAIIFGTLITQTMGHQTVLSFSPQQLFSAIIVLWKTRNTKINFKKQFKNNFEKQFRHIARLILQIYKLFERV